MANTTQIDFLRLKVNVLSVNVLYATGKFFHAYTAHKCKQ